MKDTLIIGSFIVFILFLVWRSRKAAKEQSQLNAEDHNGD